MKVKEITGRYEALKLTGNEDAVQVHDFEDLPEALGIDGGTYGEEWNVTDEEGKHLGCLYDFGSGYDYAPGYKAGHLDY